MSFADGGWRHFVRVGTFAEQRYLISGLQDTYDALLFNANLVAWAPAGVAAFLCQPTLMDKPLLIDPITHAFQHDPSFLLGAGDSEADEESEPENQSRSLKASIQRLVDAYDSPVREKAENQEACVPETFDDEGLAAAFAGRVVEFQVSRIHDVAKETDAYDLLTFERDTGQLPKLAQPSAVIAPYFYMGPTTYHDWLSVNARLIRFAKEAAEHFPVAAQVVLDKDLLYEGEAIETIIAGYRETDADLFFLWIDAFPEHEQGKQALNGLIQLAKGLRGASGRPVVNLYGGFFSILLCHPELSVLSGVAHGPQYGEDRSVVPVGGGLPTARFYLPSAHQRLRYKDALGILRKNNWLSSEDAYYKNVCDCAQCHALIDQHGPSAGFAKYGVSKSVTFIHQGRTMSRAIPTQETKEFSTVHYMHRKKDEFDSVDQDAGTHVQLMLDDLERTHDLVFSTIGKDPAGYLKLWPDVLRPLLK